MIYVNPAQVCWVADEETPDGPRSFIGLLDGACVKTPLVASRIVLDLHQAAAVSRLIEIKDAELAPDPYKGPST